MTEIKIKNLGKFLEGVEGIEFLIGFDDIIIRHLHDGSKRATSEAHLIADIFIDNDLFKDYTYERKNGENGQVYLHFSRGRK